jgi:hypothetical protein
LARQPEDADPWQAMRDAMQFLVDGATADPEWALRDMRVIMSAPALRARNTEKHRTGWTVPSPPANSPASSRRDLGLPVLHRNPQCACAAPKAPHLWVVLVVVVPSFPAD